MAKRLRMRLTYANVMSTIAVFLIVVGGGAALAAVLAKNSVKSRHIARGAVKTSDLGRNAATGAKVRESTLARVPSATRARSAATAASAANASLLDGVDSLGFARPAGIAGPITEGSPLLLDVPGYMRAFLYCDDDPAGDAGDSVAFGYEPEDNNDVQSGTVARAPGQGVDAEVRLFGGATSPGQTTADNVVSVVYRLQTPGGDRGVVVFAQGHEILGDPTCEGSIQAFRIG